MESTERNSGSRKWETEATLTEIEKNGTVDFSEFRKNFLMKRKSIETLNFWTKRNGIQDRKGY